MHLQQSETRLDRIVAAIRQLIQGRDDACGTVSLQASSASTVVSAPNCAATSAVFLSPKSAHAAAEIAAGGCYVSSVVNGSFTITHANNAQADRTFFWTARG